MEEKQLEKLDRFVHSIDREIQERIDAEIERTRSEGDALFAQTEDETLQESYNHIQAQVKQIEADYRKQLAQNEQNCRRELLAHREELVAQVFANVRKQLVAYTQTPEYAGYLCSLLKGEQLPEGAEIHLAPQDLQHKTALQPLTGGCEIVPDAAILLGGLAILNPADKQMLDKTLDTAFQEQRKAFCTTHDLKL